MSATHKNAKAQKVKTRECSKCKTGREKIKQVEIVAKPSRVKRNENEREKNGWTKARIKMM